MVTGTKEGTGNVRNYIAAMQYWWQLLPSIGHCRHFRNVLQLPPYHSHKVLTIFSKTQRLPLPPLYNSTDSSHPSIDQQHAQRSIQQEVNEVSGSDRKWMLTKPQGELLLYYNTVSWKSIRKLCRGGSNSGLTHSEQGSSSVRSDKYTLAKWIKSIPMACLEVSRNLQRDRIVDILPRLSQWDSFDAFAEKWI